MLQTRYNTQIDTQQTTSHHYRDRIGNGSSCEVYLGYEKATGKIRALKILKDRSWDRELMKEADSLMKIKRHPNIVEYYGKDQDLQTKQSCLVIEYCSGGSLHTFLKEVPNIHGLPDSEFLILFDHITSGLEHLRQHNCIHRDIKPGNILRHVTSDKRTIYKLSDFGASRIMRNCDEEFMSLAGTEEYLHPAMYEKAFVNRKSSATFNHSADLWSLGCTLYQAITGIMPFVPFDGARKNRTTMYEMVACKPHGAISGSQTSSDSPISWDYSFPPDSNMTSSLQKHILKVLVGLLDADPSRQWSFVLYKDTVTAILKLKYLVVLNCDDKAVHELYLNPTSSLVELGDEIARVTDIPAANQKLYFQQHRLEVILQGQKQIQYLSRTSFQSPLVLISQNADTNTELPITLDPYQTFHANATITTDITTATSQCGMIDTILKKMRTQKCVINGLYMATLTMWNNTQHKNYRIGKKYQPLFEIYRQLRGIFETTKRALEVYSRNGLRSVFESMNTFEFYDRLKLIKNRIEKTGYEQLSFEMPGELPEDWLHQTIKISERSQELLQRIQERKKMIMTDFEVCVHQADKIEMQELTARCIDYWQTSCAEDRRKAALLYSKNKKLYITVNRNMTEIERDLVDLDELTKKYQERFSEVLTQTVKANQNVPKQKQNLTQSKSLKAAMPEYRPAEYSVKISKSSPFPRSSSVEILEESKAFSIKIQDSLNHIPDPYTVDQDDIDYLSRKRTPENYGKENSPSESQSPQQSLPGCNTPVNESPKRLSSGRETPVNQSDEGQGSRVIDSSVGQHSSVPTLRQRDEPTVWQRNELSKIQLTRKLSSSSPGIMSVYIKQPCESSDIVSSSEAGLFQTINSGEDINPTKMLDGNKQSVSNKHGVKNPLETNTFKSLDVNLLNRMHVSTISNDSGLGTLDVKKKEDERLRKKSIQDTSRLSISECG